MDHSNCNSVTFFRAIGKYAIVILDLMTEFIKTRFEHFGRSVAFVRAMYSKVNNGELKAKVVWLV